MVCRISYSSPTYLMVFEDTYDKTPLSCAVLDKCEVKDHFVGATVGNLQFTNSFFKAMISFDDFAIKGSKPDNVYKNMQLPYALKTAVELNFKHKHCHGQAMLWVVYPKPAFAAQ